MSIQNSLYYEIRTYLREKGKITVPVQTLTPLLPEARLPSSEGTRPLYQTK